MNEIQRRRAVALAVALTANTQLAPERYERDLLERFEQGIITLDQMSDLLDARVHQVFYHSRISRPPVEDELQAILDWSQTFNEAHGITGLLLYSDGRFVQVLEGEAGAVGDLYAHIQRDSRHTQVTTVREGLGPRHFTNWSMGFGHVDLPVLEAVLTTVEQQRPLRAKITDPVLQKLLEAFT